MSRTTITKHISSPVAQHSAVSHVRDWRRSLLRHPAISSAMPRPINPWIFKINSPTSFLPRFTSCSARYTVGPQVDDDHASVYKYKVYEYSSSQSNLPHRYGHSHMHAYIGSHSVTCHPTEVTFPIAICCASLRHNHHTHWQTDLTETQHTWRAVKV